MLPKPLYNDFHYLNKTPSFLQLCEVSESLQKSRLRFHLLNFPVKMLKHILNRSCFFHFNFSCLSFLSASFSAFKIKSYKIQILWVVKIDCTYISFVLLEKTGNSTQVLSIITSFKHDLIRTHHMHQSYCLKAVPAVPANNKFHCSHSHLCGVRAPETRNGWILHCSSKSKVGSVN